MNLDFNYTPDSLKEKVSAALADAKSRVDALVASEDRGFAATFEELDRIESDLETATSSATFLGHCHADKAVRDAASEMETEVGKFEIDLSTREDLYEALKAAPKEGLNPFQARLREKIVDDFRRSGLDLPGEKREEFKTLSKRLLELGIRYNKNLAEVTDFLPVTREELEGLPADYIERLEKTGDGLYKVTLDYPDSIPFMTRAKSEDARRRLHELSNRRCLPENADLLEEILGLRRRLAALMNLPSYAHYVLEDRMAKKPETVADFLSRLVGKLSPLAKEERAKLLDLKRAEHPGAERLELWDTAYYHDGMLRRDYTVDENEVSEYFPAEKVRDGMFRLYEGLFGVRYEPVDAPVYHEEAEAYNVVDANSGEAVGRFYLDLHPRDGKFKHAAVFSLVHGRRANGMSRRPVSAMLVNFPRPAGGKPSLLTHDHVETFFHEFGHVMHGMLSESPYARFAGTRVARDFVEAPSQIMENWVWDKETLLSISGHWKTGAPLPGELFDRMLAAKRLNIGVFKLRQLAFGLIDQAYHGPREVSLDETYKRIYKETTDYAVLDSVRPEASFGHLISYAASYYGYMWADVFSSDMFSVFREAGDPRSSEIGGRYRKAVLAAGGSREESDTVRAFLGREPREDAFLESLGVN
jgi:thimet oligopeptidase